MPLWPAEGQTPRSIQHATRSVWSQHRGIILLLVGFITLGFTYSLATPLFEASDEIYHYPFVKHLADGHGLPVQNAEQVGLWRQEGSQPPLYYALAALLTRGIDTSDMDAVRQINPHANVGLIMPDRNVNMVIHTPHEGWPFHGTVLAVRLIRWLSVLMGAVTVLAAYLLGREVFPDRGTALAVAAVTGLNPMFLFITASVNNDALVTMLSSLGLWWMVRALRRPPSLAEWVGLGALLGLNILAKSSALALLGPAALTIFLVARQRRSWKEFGMAALAVALPVLAISGWWFLRNWRLYHDPLGLNAFIATVGGRNPVPTLRQLLAEWKGFVMSYWGFFGGINVPAPDIVYWALNTLAAVGLAGAPLGWWRLRRTRELDGPRRGQWTLIALWPTLVLMALVRWTLLTVASQGRLLFPALTALSALMVLGLAAWLPRRRLLLPGIMAGVLALSAAALPFITIRPAYAPPPRLTEAQVPASAVRAGVQFGQGIRLIAYELDRKQLAPGEPLKMTLYWQALAPMSENYSLFVHILGTNELILGQRDRYPGQGNLPTTLWAPGAIYADHCTVSVSPTARTPDEAQLEIGFYRLATGERLNVVDEAGQGLGDCYRFERLALPGRFVNGIPNPLHLNLGNEVALIGYALDYPAAAPGDALYLTLYWKALRDLDTNYAVFTHVLGTQDRIWAQVDGWPQGGDAPTATWRQGQVIKDDYELVVVDNAPPGVYDLEIGMYDEKGRRLNLLGEGGHVVDTRILLSKVRILPAP